jgi:acyl-CoA dehydrogenase
MKIFSLRANDYIRTATLKDRRYLLYTPMVKMKVTMQGELVMDTLMDVISARGFEKDTYFEMAAKWIRGLPRLEGTVHVNMALVVKFMQNYFFNHEVFPEVPRVEGIASDDFLFDQGTTSGLSSIRFHDYKIAFDAFDLPNVDIFKKQIEALKEFIIASASDMARFSEQSKDIDFLFALGEIFSVVVYGQLILEYAMLDPSEATNDLIDQIFDVLIRDYSRNATILYGKESTSDKQMDACLKMIIKPAVDPERRSRIWNEHVIALKDVYSMNE